MKVDAETWKSSQASKKMGKIIHRLANLQWMLQVWVLDVRLPVIPGKKCAIIINRGWCPPFRKHNGPRMQLWQANTAFSQPTNSISGKSSHKARHSAIGWTSSCQRRDWWNDKSNTTTTTDLLLVIWRRQVQQTLVLLIWNGFCHSETLFFWIPLAGPIAWISNRQRFGAHKICRRIIWFHCNSIHHLIAKASRPVWRTTWVDESAFFSRNRTPSIDDLYLVTEASLRSRNFRREYFQPLPGQW